MEDIGILFTIISVKLMRLSVGPCAGSIRRASISKGDVLWGALSKDWMTNQRHTSRNRQRSVLDTAFSKRESSVAGMSGPSGNSVRRSFEDWVGSEVVVVGLVL